MQEYLATIELEPKTEVNARKETFQRDKALELLNQSTKLMVAKGKKRVDVDLKKEELGEAELLKLVLGPTGNLRAPTLQVGKTLVVGFNQEMLDELF